MPRSSPPRSRAPSPRQFVNDLLGQESFERGDAVAGHLPIELHVQITSGCNLDCLMCSEHLRPVETRHGRGLRTIDPALFERIEREVMPYSSKLHLGVGGEPMLAPDFLQIVERAHARNQEIHLTTNGTRIATERVAEVLARCVASIEISADGATAETYERIRAGASFARLVQNVEFLNRYRLDRPAGERPRLTLCFVLLGSNAHELPQFVELAARLHADGVAAWPAIPVTPEARADAFDAERARPFLAAARARARELGLALDLPFEHANGAAEPANARAESLRRLGEAERRASGAPASARHWCHMPSVALYLFWDGRVYPCANPETHAGPPLGDLSRQSFAEIWNGRPFRNLRAGLARGDAPAVCRRCPILHSRRGPVASGEVATAESDLLGWYGERDLAPSVDAPPAGALVDAVVASGLGAHVQRRFEAQTAYATGLEQDARALAERAGTLEHERDAARLHLDALVVERGHLKGHVENVVRERDAARGHADTLSAERVHLAGHAGNLQRERDLLARNVAALEALVRALDARRGAAEHARDVADARRAVLAVERTHLVQHARTLEEERRHLVRHAANLERILERIRGRSIHRSLARVKDAFVTPAPRAETPYVPPWVADGTRRPDEPLADAPPGQT